MLNLVVVGSLVAALAGGGNIGAPIVIEPTVPPPSAQILIEVVTVNGSGCPLGTAAVAVSPDNTAFTVTYSDYLAQVGVGARPTDFRKNCQLNLKVHVPTGFTYAILQADYRGYGFLETGATAQQRANYYFQGMSQTTMATHTYSGPLDDNWQNTDMADVAAVVWHPCGEQRNLNINTELRVNAGSSNPAITTSFMSMDSTDGAINTKYHFGWQRCPTPKPN